MTNTETLVCVCVYVCVCVCVCIYMYIYRVMELSARYHDESTLKTQRLRSAQLQAEKLLDMRERVNKQRVNALQQQVSITQHNTTQWLTVFRHHPGQLSLAIPH